MLERDRHSRITLKRGLAGQQLKQQTPCGIQVRTGINLFAASLFGRKILGGTHHRIGLCHGGLGIGQGAGNPKVHHLDFPGRGNHHIAGLNVAVYQVLMMGILQRVQDTGNDFDRFFQRNRIAVRQQLPHRVAFHVLHDDVRHLYLGAVRSGDGFFTSVIDSHDSGMVQIGG